MKFQSVGYIGTVALLAACSGGGSSGSSNVPTPLQPVSGTLTIGSPQAQSKGVGAKLYAVSPSTGHASVFIDGAAIRSGSTSTCSATGCTIAWSAQLAAPAHHVFAVETDTGANAPANTVLSEGAGSYEIVPGSGNSLAALSLNGVVKQATFAVTTCSGVSPKSLCNGTVVLATAAGTAVTYTGTAPVPTTGNNPSSGNVFDNAAVTFVSASPASGLVTGTAQTSGSNVFSTDAANILTVSGVNTTGTYTYQATCAGKANGTFGITVGGASTPSSAVTTAELAALTTPVTYPAAGITVIGSAPLFTCAAGNISSSTGTLPVSSRSFR